MQCVETKGVENEGEVSEEEEVDSEMDSEMETNGEGEAFLLR